MSSYLFSPAAVMTSFHLLMSASIALAKSCGLPPMPWALIAPSPSLPCSPSLARRDSLSMTSRRVRAGAKRATPDRTLVARQVGGLRHGGNIGCQWGSLILRRGKGPKLTSFDMRPNDSDRPEERHHAATQDIDNRLRGALVGDVHELDTRKNIEKFATHVRHRSNARSRVTNLLRLGLGQSDELPHVRHSEGRIDDKKVGY